MRPREEEGEDLEGEMEQEMVVMRDLMLVGAGVLEEEFSWVSGGWLAEGKKLGPVFGWTGRSPRGPGP